jgi:hypothetical protein
MTDINRTKIMAENEEGFIICLTSESTDWINVKLIKLYGPKVIPELIEGKKRRRGKANWWIGFSKTRQVAVNSSDYGWLTRHRIDIASWVEDVILAYLKTNNRTAGTKSGTDAVQLRPKGL